MHDDVMDDISYNLNAFHWSIKKNYKYINTICNYILSKFIFIYGCTICQNSQFNSFVKARGSYPCL
jgi:hypothetical protein